MRIILGIILFGLVIWAPWWLVAVVGIAGLIFYERYFEIIFAAIMIDAIYGTNSGFSIFNLGIGRPLIFTISSIILFIVFYYGKRRIRPRGNDTI